MLREKKHMLVFLTGVGEFVIATDNINEIADEGWFREFLQLHGPPRVTTKPAPQSVPQQPAPAQQSAQRPQQPAQQSQPALPQQPLGPASVPPQAQQTQQQRAQFDTTPRPPAASQVPPSTFLEIHPDKMGRDIWESLQPEQQTQWMQRWNIGN